MPFTDDGKGSFSITSNFSLSTYIPLAEIRCLSIMPSCTIKWHFSQFSTRLVSSHLISTNLRFSRQLSREFPNTENSSMNTSIVFSTIYENMAIIQRWNVLGSWCIAQPKGHSPECECTIRVSESHLLLILWGYSDLIVTGIPSKK